MPSGLFNGPGSGIENRVRMGGPGSSYTLRAMLMSRSRNGAGVALDIFFPTCLGLPLSPYSGTPSCGKKGTSEREFFDAGEFVITKSEWSPSPHVRLGRYVLQAYRQVFF